MRFRCCASRTVQGKQPKSEDPMILDWLLNIGVLIASILLLWKGSE